MDGTLLDDPLRYHCLAGSLIYLTIIRPDIAYAIHIVNQFMSAPFSTYYVAVLKILFYVKCNLFHGLHCLAHSFLNFVPTLMLIGLVILLMVVLLLGFVSFWVIL